ncbi:hypothetical protein ACJX0J_013763, partial [Zea mays]
MPSLIDQRETNGFRLTNALGNCKPHLRSQIATSLHLSYNIHLLKIYSNKHFHLHLFYFSLFFTCSTPIALFLDALKNIRDLRVFSSFEDPGLLCPDWQIFFYHVFWFLTPCFLGYFALFTEGIKRKPWITL